MSDPQETFRRLSESAEEDPWPEVDTRLSRLRALRTAILSKREDVGRAVLADFGKSAVEADLTEVLPVLLELKTALRHLKSWTAPRKLHGTFPLWGLSSRVQYGPKGVVLIISPWNHPVNLSLGPLVSAISAGNRVVIKPSERVPRTSQLVAEIIADALPADVATVIEGGPETGSQLLDLPFDHFFFTGGARVGREVMHAAARHLSTATLELGGKSPAIVDGSVELDECAEKIVRGKFMNGGQTCIAPDYTIVHDEYFDDFVEVIAAHARRLEGRTEMARPVDARQAAHLETLLTGALDDGAAIHHRGTDGMGLTIATGVPLTCRLMREEIFGPILPILRYRSEEELIGIIRANPSPLTMYIFSKNEPLIDTLTRRLKTGSICINETLLHFVHPRLPFGGVGKSGSGRSHGYAGFKEFSNAVPIMRQNFRKGLIPLLYPSTGGLQERAREMLFRILGR